MKRKLLITLISIYIILFLTALISFTIWKIDLNRHFGLTEKYGHEFESYEVHNVDAKVDIMSVIDYSPNSARVFYYFKGNKENGSFIYYYKKVNNNWEISEKKQ